MCVHASENKCTWACASLHVKCVCQRGGASRPLNYWSAKTLTSILEPLSLPVVIHYWEDAPKENKTKEESWYTRFMGSSTDQVFKYWINIYLIYSLAAKSCLSMNVVHIKVTLCLCKFNKQMEMKWRLSMKICCYILHILVTDGRQRKSKVRCSGKIAHFCKHWMFWGNLVCFSNYCKMS